MRPNFAIRPLLLVLIVLFPALCFGQPPKTDRDLVDSGIHWRFAIEGIRWSWDDLEVESDTGVFVDSNGVITQTRRIDNTEAARRDLKFDFETTSLDLTPSFRLGTGPNPWVTLSGTVHVGGLELSHVNPQQVETTYDSSTGIVGLGVSATRAEFMARSERFWARVIADADYSRLHRGSGTRTPAQPGVNLTSERNEIDAEIISARASFDVVTRTSDRTAFGISAGGGYVWGDFILKRELGIDFGQGATSEATLRTELSKDGPFGIIRATVGVGGRISVFADTTFGAQSGFSFGGTIGLK